MLKQLWVKDELWGVEVERLATGRVEVYVRSSNSSSMIRMPREVAKALHAELTRVLYPPQNTEAPNGVCEGSRAEQDAPPPAEAECVSP